MEATVKNAVSSNQYLPEGDCNADGSFNIADVVLLQKWLLSVPNAELKDWRSGDLDRNGVLNAIDLSLMKIELLRSETK